MLENLSEKNRKIVLAITVVVLLGAAAWIGYVLFGSGGPGPVGNANVNPEDVERPSNMRSAPGATSDEDEEE